MFCPNCSEEFKEGQAYCSKCGAKLPAGGKSSAVEETSKPTGPTWDEDLNLSDVAGTIFLILLALVFVFLLTLSFS